MKVGVKETSVHRETITTMNSIIAQLNETSPRVEGAGQGGLSLCISSSSSSYWLLLVPS